MHRFDLGAVEKTEADHRAFHRTAAVKSPAGFGGAVRGRPAHNTL